MLKSKAELILDKWKAELIGKDRSRAAVSGNFDELFSAWHRSKVQFEEAYSLLEVAIKVHYPSDSIARSTYRMLKRDAGIPKNELEFTTEWKQNISSTAKQVFYSLYDIDGVSAPAEDVKYGSMSAPEYRKQRKYADSHPLLDWTKIKIEPLEEEEDGSLDVDLGDL